MEKGDDIIVAVIVVINIIITVISVSCWQKMALRK